MPSSFMLMDKSKAAPPAGLDMEKLLSQFDKKSAATHSAPKTVYDGSSYMKQLREEDPWPLEIPAPPCLVSISNCRFLEAGPIDLMGSVTIAVDIKALGPIPGPDRFVMVSLYALYREPDMDTEVLRIPPVRVALGAEPVQTLRYKVALKGPWKHEHPKADLFLRALVSHPSQTQKLGSPPISTLSAPTVVRRVRLSGLVFDANKCFLLPESLPGIAKIEAMHRKHPLDQMVVVGHAEGEDELGGPDLALARAKTVCALLTNNWAEWLPWFAPSVPERQRWGLREVQLMLGALPESGTRYYAGGAAGIEDTPTLEAIRAFQKASKLPDNGKVDSGTRKELLRAYFGRQNSTISKSIVPIAHGCQGQLPDKTDSGCGDARRLEVFFFETRLEPKPSGDFSKPGSKEYPAWLSKLAETDDFAVHGIHLQIRDAGKRPLPGALAHLSGPIRSQAVADAHGFVTFRGLVPGQYALKAELDGEVIGVSKLTYPATTQVNTTRHNHPAPAAAGDRP